MKARSHNGFNIPQPCNMDWDKMAKVEDQSRHCSSCNKVIVDFSKMNDEQLLKFLSDNGHACGRFSKQQLNRKLIAYGTTKGSFSWKSLFLFPALLLGIGASAKNKEVVPSSVVNTIADKTNSIIGDPKTPFDSTLTFSGSVRDKSTTEAIPFATVQLFTAKDTFNTTTDINGLFSFKLNEALKGDSARLEVRYVGYTTITKNVALSPVCVIAEMEQDEITYTMGVMVIDYQTPLPKKNVFQRIFGKQK